MSDTVMASCASKVTDQLAGPMDLGSNVCSWNLVSGMGTCYFGVGNNLSYLCELVGGGQGCRQPGEEVPLTWTHAL